MNYPKGFIIYDFMMKELELKGNELLLYAFIYSVTIVGDGCYHGNIKYLSNLLNVNETTIISTLKKLVDKQLILKNEILKNNVKFCEYRTNNGVWENPTTPGEIPYNNIYNNINNINNNINNIELEKTTPGKDLVEELFNDYTDNDKLYDTLMEFSDYRKEKKKPLTERAAKGVLKELDKLKTDKEKIQCIERSIMSDWTGVFANKENNTPKKKNLHDESDLKGVIRPTKRRIDS